MLLPRFNRQLPEFHYTITHETIVRVQRDGNLLGLLRSQNLISTFTV